MALRTKARRSPCGSLGGSGGGGGGRGSSAAELCCAGTCSSPKPLGRVRAGLAAALRDSAALCAGALSLVRLLLSACQTRTCLRLAAAVAADAAQGCGCGAPGLCCRPPRAAAVGRRRAARRWLRALASCIRGTPPRVSCKRHLHRLLRGRNHKSTPGRACVAPLALGALPAAAPGSVKVRGPAGRAESQSPLSSTRVRLCRTGAANHCRSPARLGGGGEARPELPVEEDDPLPSELLLPLPLLLSLLLLLLLLALGFDGMQGRSAAHQQVATRHNATPLRTGSCDRCTVQAAHLQSEGAGWGPLPH